MIKALFFDIDGTLVSIRTHKCTDADREALIRAHEKGIKLFIATGRHLGTRDEGYILDYLPDIFDGFISMNGQRCYLKDGEEILRCSLDPDDARYVARTADEHGIPCLCSAFDSLFITIINDTVRDHNALLGLPLPPQRPVRLDEPMAGYCLYIRPEDEPLIKKGLRHSTTMSWATGVMDVVPNDGGKDVGLLAMAERFGIKREETMAFGDGKNDVAMIRAAGIGVAMGECADELAAAADFRAPDCEDSGVAFTLRKFGVI